MNPLIIHHGGCADGVGAAWWLSLHLDATPEVRPWGYNQPAPTVDDVADREVFIVDFCFPAEVLDQIARHALALIVLDHHQTAVEFVADAKVNHYGSVSEWAADAHPTSALIVNQGRSGIGNVIEFCEEIGSELAVPEFLLDLEDRDLWRFDRPNTMQVFATITSLQLDPEQFTAWSKMDYDEIVAIGSGIDRYRQQLVGQVSTSAFTLWLDDVPVPCASSPYAIGSDVAGRLAEENDVGIGAYVILHETDVQVGLRSRGNGPDVAKLAEQYGGGGHTHASGLRLTWPAFIEACRVG